jgi:hypothetical protein
MKLKRYLGGFALAAGLVLAPAAGASAQDTTTIVCQNTATGTVLAVQSNVCPAGTTLVLTPVVNLPGLP